MYCSECGKELPDGSLFCTECGANLVPDVNKYPANKKRISFVRWMAIVFTTMAFVADCTIQLLAVMVPENTVILVINGIVCILLCVLLFIITIPYKKVFFTSLSISIIFAGLTSAAVCSLTDITGKLSIFSAESMKVGYSLGLIIALAGMLVLSVTESIIIAINNHRTISI